MGDSTARELAVLQVNASAAELVGFLEELRGRGLDVQAVHAGSARAEALRAVRMDASARTARALAHEIANYLGTIRTMAYLLAEEVSADSDAHVDVATVTDTVVAGTAFLDAIRAFVHPEPLGDGASDLNAVARGAEPELLRALGARATLAYQLAAGPLWVRGGPSPLGRLLVDLVSAASAGVVEGGALSVETGLDGDRPGEQAAPALPGAPGAAVRLAVRVRGRELEPDVLARIFEPFVADRGHEGGLRLPTVYAVVTESGGTVAAESAPGAGVTFRVCLPSAPAPSAAGGGKGSGL